jgi:hypothetical protein
MPDVPRNTRPANSHSQATPGEYTSLTHSKATARSVHISLPCAGVIFSHLPMYRSADRDGDKTAHRSRRIHHSLCQSWPMHIGAVTKRGENRNRRKTARATSKRVSKVAAMACVTGPLEDQGTSSTGNRTAGVCGGPESAYA